MLKLEKIIEKFPQAHILVVGDLILDEYIWGEVERISPEAPVPVVWAKKRTFLPGGAANVAHNIASLDADVSLVGVVGEDKNRDILVSSLKQVKINTQAIFVEPKRQTTLKTRIIAGHQQVVRVDWEETTPISQKTNHKIFNYVKNHLREFDALIIEDYGKGVINKDLLKALISLGHKNKKIITVDPKEEHFSFYRNVTTITPNRKELENAVRNLKIKDTTNRFKFNNDKLTDLKDITLAGKEIIKYLDLDCLLVTLGEAGMQLLEKNKPPIHIPTVAQEVFDVSGAGDTVVATFTLGLCSGATKLMAAHLANFAAGIVVGKIGTAVVTRKEILERIKLK